MADVPTWIGADGDSYDLDGSAGVKVLRGVEGRGLPPVSTVADELAGLDGSRPRLSRATEREVAVPVLVKGASWWESVRTLASLFDPRRGNGRLRWGDRELVCRYSEGLELDESEGIAGSHQKAVLVFVAHDPLWRDVDPTVRTVGVDDVAFLSPDSETAWFPWETVAEDALGEFEVDNDSDDQVWPVWTIQGPGSGALSLENLTSGEVIELASVSLLAGEQIVIDTRPEAKTATGPDGSNLWPDLSDDSELWPLVRGAQKVKVLLEGASPGESSVRLEYRRRWLTV